MTSTHVHSTDQFPNGPRPLPPTAHPGPFRTRADPTIRPLGPDDRELIADAIEQLSPRSRRMRFASPMPRIPERLLRHLCSVDGRDHIAWGVFVGHRLIAVGRFVRFANDPATADVAVEVGDDWQRQGLGPRLIDLLAYSAREVGVERFSFAVSGDNRPAQKMLARFGVDLHYTAGLGEGRIPVVDLLGRRERLRRAAA